MVWAIFCGILPAQAQEDPSAPLIGDIGIEFVDIRNVSDEAVMARLQIRRGIPYSQVLVDRSIRSLYDTRLFDFIEARTEQMPQNQVRVIFVLQARYRVQEVRITGNDNVRSRRIEREMQIRPARSLDERQIRRDAVAIEAYYQRRGFSEVSVDYEIERDASTGLGIVTFRISEGPRLKIKRVEFVGNTAFSDRQLRREMETRRRWMLSWLTGSGRFDEGKFQDDLDRLRRRYLNAGYLDVSIPEANVTIENPSPREILVTIRIDEGRRYRVGDIYFVGNTLFSDLDLYFALNLLPGDWFSPETLDDDVERLTNIYGALGYLDTFIRPERVANIQTGDIDLVFHISESERFELESIIIEGNTKTKSTVIIRELAMAPGRTFNLVNMKTSEARLRNTRFFEQVRLTPEATNIPGRRNLKIRVEEGRTGNFQFGAGFSSLERAVFFFEVTQSNFDLFKWRSPLLQGDGQKFRFRASYGSRSNEIVLGFEEPWLFEERLALGFELYRRQTDFNSTVYDELRAGIEVYLRKRLIGLIDGQLSYTLERINIDLNIPRDNAPISIGQEADISPRYVSRIAATVLRDTRNDLIFTTRGSRMQVTGTFAGIGGDTQYVGLETRNAFFVPTFELGDQVISFLARAGGLHAYNFNRAQPDPSKDVPFFDRYFLGGPNSLRGFEFREVGPVDTSGNFFEPVGGRSYAFASVEYSVRVADPLRLAVFYDWGFVNSREFDFNPANYNDNWGFGIRLLVLGNPLRLDFGIPLRSGQYDENSNQFIRNRRGNQFNFAFGTRF